MSTLTGNVRYNSLLAAARYHRMLAGKAAEERLLLPAFLRRVEAIVAFSSVLHHRGYGAAPLGIVGWTVADQISDSGAIELDVRVQRPAYDIYRGTMSALEIIDLNELSQPLFEGARALASSWRPSDAGPVGKMLQTGVLPEQLPRDLLEHSSASFCLCSVPDGSEEQAELVNLLFGFGKTLDLSAFVSESSVGQVTSRALSWRFVMTLVTESPDERLSNYRLMARLLQDDLLSAGLTRQLRTCLMAWRWVAARMFFERGWTRLFKRALEAVLPNGYGITRQALRESMEQDYSRDYADEPLATLIAEVERNCASRQWLSERYLGQGSRDSLLVMLAGICIARRDLEANDFPLLLVELWRNGTIPFEPERSRLRAAMASCISAATFWAELAEQTLAEHVQSSLSKMRSGNPDSLLVDFDEGRWLVPDKALDAAPEIAIGSSRLDIALGWAEQLGLLTTTAGTWRLTATGEDYCQSWDKEHLM